MTFVVSAGQLTGLDRSVPAAPMSVQLTDDQTSTFAAIYSSQPQIRTVISFLARNIAQIGLHVYERVSDTDRARLTDHPLARIIAQPNGWTTRYRWLDSLVHDLGIFDNAVFVKLRPANGGRPSILRLPPQLVTPIGDNWITPEAYRFRGNRGHRDFAPEDVIHFRGHNPHDSRWGLSPMETLRGLLAEELSAGEYRRQLWRNGARFSGYLSRGLDAPKWSGPARDRFEMDWRGQYTGSGPNAGGTPILEDGMTFVPAAVTPEQAQYLQARKLTREEVASAFHVPLPMVGILDHATFSNIQEQHKQLYQDTLGPWLQMIQEEIELQLLPDLDDSAAVYCEFNLKEKLRGSFEEQAAQLQAAVGGPWLTRNEARALQNLPQLDGGDELIVPLNVVEGGQASPQDSAPPATSSRPAVSGKARADRHADEVTRRVAAFFSRQETALVSMLGAAKARGKVDVGEVWDGQRWDRELATDLTAINLLVSTAAGRATMEALKVDPDAYDTSRTDAWLAANAEGVAAGVNTTTKAQLAEALTGSEDPLASLRTLFAGIIAARAAQIAVTQLTAVSGFATNEAATQSGKQAIKSWTVMAKNPRPSHAAMGGESVPVGELFSNGARWPGDSVLGADDRAGCTCDMTITEA